MDRSARIADAILAHADDLVIGSPPLPVAFEGVTVKPPVKPKYLYVQYRPNIREQPGIGDGDSKIHIGVLLVSIYWTNGVGLVAPLEAAETVINHFDRSQRLYGDGFRVEFRRAYASSPLQENAYLHIPVTIEWRAVANG